MGRLLLRPPWGADAWAVGCTAVTAERPAPMTGAAPSALFLWVDAAWRVGGCAASAVWTCRGWAVGRLAWGCFDVAAGCGRALVLGCAAAAGTGGCCWDAAGRCFRVGLKARKWSFFPFSKSSRSRSIPNAFTNDCDRRCQEMGKSTDVADPLWLRIRSTFSRLSPDFSLLSRFLRDYILLRY